jgi:membrane-associated phospholipid phosphatase
MKKNKIRTIFTVLCYLFIAQKTVAQQQWKPFYAEIKLATIAPPPGVQQTKDELKEILSLQPKLDTLLLRQIHFWHAGPPSYVWSNVANNLSDTAAYWIRTEAYMQVAIYDALLAAKAGNVYKRTAPYQLSAKVKNRGTVSDYSYPCNHSVAAGAAATVLGYLFPAKKDSLMQVANQVADMRVAAGLQYRSDTKEGLKLGIAIAQQIIKRAMADGYDKFYTDTLPKGRMYYTGKPIKRELHKMKTWVLTSPSQFRSSPPPSDIEKDMELIRAFKRTDEGKWKSYHWEFSNPWGEVLSQKVLEYHLTPLEAAFAYALVGIANYDFMTAHWDGKYTYFRARPDQYDTTFKAISPTPPSPSYPAGHGTSAYTNANVLSYLFPYDSALFYQMAEEANNSRFEAGFHYPSDNEAGKILGEKIGKEIVKWGKQHEGTK